MKKIFLTFLLLLAIPVSGLTLWEWYGGKLPSVKERAPTFNSYFPDEKYQGTAEQNTRFVNALQRPTLGAALQNIDLTDTVRTALFTKVNANFNQLANTTTPNTFSSLLTIANSSTTKADCYGSCAFGATATSSFSTAGALTLVTPLTVANGGTGSTTLSSGQVLMGSSTNAITGIGWGTSGQVLTSNGVGTQPTYQSLTVGLAENNVWTGTNGFGTSSLAATPVSIQGNTYISGTTTTANLNLASSTPIHSRGTNISIASDLGGAVVPLTYYRNFNVTQTTTSSSTTTLATLVLPANFLTANSLLKIDTTYTSNLSGSGCAVALDLGTGAASSSIAYGGGTAGFLTKAYGVHTALATQSSTVQIVSSVATAGTIIAGYATSTAYSTASALYISFDARATGANTNCTLDGYAVTIFKN